MCRTPFITNQTQAPDEDEMLTTIQGFIDADDADGIYGWLDGANLSLSLRARAIQAFITGCVENALRAVDLWGQDGLVSPAGKPFRTYLREVLNYLLTVAQPCENILALIATLQGILGNPEHVVMLEWIDLLQG